MATQGALGAGDSGLDDLTASILFYGDQFEALYELIDAATALSTSLDSPEARTAELRAIMETMPEEELAPFRAFLQRYVDRGDDVLNAPDYLRDLLSVFIEDTPWAAAVLHGSLELLLRSQRSPLLAQSLLVSIVGALETLVGNVVAQYFRAFPDSLEDVPGEQEREFSLKELRQLSALAEVDELALGRRVDAVLFAGVAGWRRFFSKFVHVELSAVIPDWAGLEEVFERRHAVVHHGGRASRRYVRFAHTSGLGADVRLGALLSCTSDYLRDATDRLQAAGLSICLATWSRVHETDAASSSSHLLVELERVSDRSLRHGGYRVTATTAEWIRQNMPDRLDDNFVIRELLAKKRRSGSSESVRSEVVAWEPQQPSRRIELAKLVLLGATDAACDLLVELATSRQLSAYDVVSWPIVRELGGDARVKLARERLARRGKP